MLRLPAFGGSHARIDHINYQLELGNNPLSSCHDGLAKSSLDGLAYLDKPVRAYE